MSFITIPIVLGNNTGLGSGSLVNVAPPSSGNTAIGKLALYNMSAGTDNTAIGENAMRGLGGNGGNTAVGKDAIKGGGAGNSSAFGAGGVLQNVNGTLNAAFGYGAGSLLANANKNSIFGSFSGNQGGLDIRDLSNYIVLSDGDGNPRLWINDTGAVNIPGGIALTGSLSITGGTITANNPVLSATQTWNNAAVTFTGWQLNVTDTASNANSLLMDLQVGGASRFAVSKAGAVFGGAAQFAASFAVTQGFNVALWNNAAFGWSASGSVSPTTTNFDLVLLRDAANTLAQRNGVNAQTLRVYNTFTDASNYERGAFQWASNELQIRSESAGTGIARSITIRVGAGGNLVAFFNALNGRSIVFGELLATNATSGFVYVPTCAGTPTGGPEIYTGRAPIVIDTTNNKLYFYSGGAWRDAGP